MASIFHRRNKDGSITWRVMIRRKGLPNFITAFSSQEDAITFVDLYENVYCLDPENFTYDNLKSKRERKFARV